MIKQLSSPKAIIAFDFDQTLSIYHIFKCLSGWDQSMIPPPYGKSEWGHIHKVIELNKYQWKFQNNVPVYLKKEPEENNPNQFSQIALGGINRINTLDQYFKEFTEKNCKIIVITKGYVGVVNKILKDSGLSKYNIDVYGNTSTAYGKNSYDEEAMKEDYSEFLGGQDKQNEYSKGRLLVMLAEANKLKSKDCILIDDDPNEINSALQHNCEGMHVSKRQGVTLEQLQLVSSWVQQKQ